ncbi:MAG: hypothetical protein DHS20C21_10250 [Gemmatimonadota bacterium]|nr:MAG: hypothetical protein DHS20C21_10250 [Gemmatimonadota bacterium]
MADDIQITEIESGAHARVLRISGRLDAKNAQALVGRCHELRDRGTTNVIVNLKEISFVASSGIGSLLALTETFKDANGALRLVELSSAVSSVVEILNLGQFLEIAATEDEALAAIGV